MAVPCRERCPKSASSAASRSACRASTAARSFFRFARRAASDGGPCRRKAARCLALCDEHAAPPFERFFGTAALALAQRDAGEANAFAASRERAAALHAALPADERAACDAVLAELDAR